MTKLLFAIAAAFLALSLRGGVSVACTTDEIQNATCFDPSDPNNNLAPGSSAYPAVYGYAVDHYPGATYLGGNGFGYGIVTDRSYWVDHFTGYFDLWFGELQIGCDAWYWRTDCVAADEWGIPITYTDSNGHQQYQTYACRVFDHWSCEIE